MSAKPNEQPVTDDQELARVLAGNATQQKNDIANDVKAQLGGLQFEESPVPANQQVAKPPTITPSPSAAAANAQKPAAAQQQQPAPSQAQSAPAPTTAQQSTPAQAAPASTGNTSLDELKKDALEQLRPLVDKLNLPAEEKFDTLLLIIRSTDDQSLLDSAHTAAKAIQDDSRRAQALLDVIKEIDFFSGQGQA